MTTATQTIIHDSRLASARSKGTLGDARKDERAAFTRSIRRAGRVSIADALDELEEEDDFALELLIETERQEAFAPGAEEELQALLAEFDALMMAQS